MKRPKNNARYWIFKVASVIVSCAFPLWALYERYPVWFAFGEKKVFFGAGGIVAVLVVLFVMRKSVFGFLREKLKLRYAPPFIGWLFPMFLGYAIIYINSYAYDVVHVSKMGLIGGAIGMGITFIAENFLKVNKEEVNNG